MKFCRNCGASLAAPPPAAGPPPVYTPPPSPAVSHGAFGVAPTLAAPSPSSAARPAGPPGTIVCPRCATATPTGFAFCQQCGLQLNAVAPTDPGAGAAVGRARPATANPPPVGSPYAPSFKLNAAVDPHAGTLAADSVKSSPGGAPRAIAPTQPPPAATAAAAWGTAVLVNRDGSDGQRYPLVSDDTLIGRVGADISFEEDRFLAREHARIERLADRSAFKVHPLDTTNGVFKKTDASVELADGAIVLVGREVLRFERVAPEEKTVHPLVRHGVALFGSPPREPWGRIVQLIPSGGYRDVRHLIGDEVVLGREEGDLVYRDDAFMSRRHAAITWNGQRAMLTDLGSSNGTFVRLAGATTLKSGDHIRLGDQLLRIER